MRSEIKDELRKHGLNEEIVKLLAEKNKVADFQELIKVYNKPDLVGKMLTLWSGDLINKLNKTAKEVEDRLGIDVLETILQSVGKKIEESDIFEVMKDIVRGKKVEDAVKREKVGNLDEEIMKLIKEKPGLSKNAYMGLVMAKFKVKVNGKEVSSIIEKLVK